MASSGPPLAVQGAAAICRRLPRIRGRGALGLRWHRRFVADGGAWDVRLSNGLRMRLPLASSQTWTTAFTGRYADAERAIDVLRPYVVPHTWVLDIGASLGLFTVPAAIAVRQVDAKVCAYEPVPGNVEYLRRNVDTHELGGVVDVRPVALGQVAGSLQLAVEGAGSGNASVMDGLSAAECERHGRAGHLDQRVRVPVTTLDDDFSGSCSAIKIDVEGFELDVLSGGEALIARDRPAIYAEFSEGWMSSRGLPRDAPERWAEAHGYRIYSFPTTRGRAWREAALGAPELGRRWPGDILLLPAELNPR